jgi:hypothetical protein
VTLWTIGEALELAEIGVKSQSVAIAQYAKDQYSTNGTLGCAELLQATKDPSVKLEQALVALLASYNASSGTMRSAVTTASLSLSLSPPRRCRCHHCVAVAITTASLSLSPARHGSLSRPAVVCCADAGNMWLFNVTDLDAINTEVTVKQFVEALTSRIDWTVDPVKVAREQQQTAAMLAAVAGPNEVLRDILQALVLQITVQDIQRVAAVEKEELLSSGIVVASYWDINSDGLLDLDEVFEAIVSCSALCVCVCVCACVCV